jgi:hypothetical protein
MGVPELNGNESTPEAHTEEDIQASGDKAAMEEAVASTTDEDNDDETTEATREESNPDDGTTIYLPILNADGREEGDDESTSIDEEAIDAASAILRTDDQGNFTPEEILEYPIGDVTFEVLSEGAVEANYVSPDYENKYVKRVLQEESIHFVQQNPAELQYSKFTADAVDNQVK